MSIQGKEFFKIFFHCFLLAFVFSYISGCAFTTGFKVPHIQTIPDYQGENLSKRAFITLRGTVEYDLENQKSMEIFMKEKTQILIKFVVCIYQSANSN